MINEDKYDLLLIADCVSINADCVSINAGMPDSATGTCVVCGVRFFIAFPFDLFNDYRLCFGRCSADADLSILNSLIYVLNLSNSF